MSRAPIVNFYYDRTRRDKCLMCFWIGKRVIARHVAPYIGVRERLGQIDNPFKSEKYRALDGNELES